jgi:hypothetical protein
MEAFFITYLSPKFPTILPLVTDYGEVVVTFVTARIDFLSRRECPRPPQVRIKSFFCLRCSPVLAFRALSLVFSPVSPAMCSTLMLVLDPLGGTIRSWQPPKWEPNGCNLPGSLAKPLPN